MKTCGETNTQPASASLRLKPVERHTALTQETRAKGGEQGTERNVAMRGELPSPLDPRTEARRSATRARGRILPCPPSPQQERRASPAAGSRQCGAAPDHSRGASCSSRRNRRKPLKRRKTTRPDRHFGTTPWRTPNPCGGGVRAVGEEVWRTGGGRGEGAAPRRQEQEPRQQHHTTTASNNTGTGRVEQGVVVVYGGGKGLVVGW
jgi:hypothetical protein